MQLGLLLEQEGAVGDLLRDDMSKAKRRLRILCLQRCQLTHRRVEEVPSQLGVLDGLRIDRAQRAEQEAAPDHGRHSHRQLLLHRQTVESRQDYPLQRVRDAVAERPRVTDHCTRVPIHDEEPPIAQGTNQLDGEERVPRRSLHEQVRDVPRKG
jgi:hypothetical protein